MKKSNKQVEENLLTELNSFMKDFGIEGISFGKHSISKTKGKKAKKS